MEHRWGVRHAVSCPVHLRTRGGLRAPGRLCSVSISGGFVVTPLPVPLLSYVEVLLMPQTRERGWGPAIEGGWFVTPRRDSGSSGVSSRPGPSGCPA